MMCDFKQEDLEKYKKNQIYHRLFNEANEEVKKMGGQITSRQIIGSLRIMARECYELEKKLDEINFRLETIEQDIARLYRE